jgi:LuxR family transcriptional regulator of csgAB operon
MTEMAEEVLEFPVRLSLKSAKITAIAFENLQTSGLLSAIQKRHRIPCVRQSKVEKISLNQNLNNLILIDCGRMTFVKVFELIDHASLQGEHCYIALFNMKKNSRFESLVARPQVKGIFYNTCSISTVLHGLEDILCGSLWIPRHLMERMVNAHRRLPSKRVGSDVFTPREQQILHSLCMGYTNQSIALEMGLSEHTVKSHLYNLFKKHGFKNRLEACAWARDRLDKGQALQ